MTSAELLADAFDRVQETVHEAVEGLTASQLTARLDDDANSIAWLCWHLARVQDDHVAGAFGVPQVWMEYGKRFELPFEPSDIGYGHSSGQVSEVTASSPDLLVGSHAASTTRVRSASVIPDTSRMVCSCTASWYPASRSADEAVTWDT